MKSERLHYRPVSLALVDDFHGLVQDPHVRRYLMDGQIFPREWSADRVRASEALFARRGVGLWLAWGDRDERLHGFCGFLEIPDLHPEPQLVYALFERFTGQGCATEMARAAIAEARAHAGFEEIIAGVDGVNKASLRVLEKLGFEPISTFEGSFGPSLLLRLRSTPRPTEPG